MTIVFQKQMRKETLIGSLVNLLGGAIFGYNIGIVSGLAPSLIGCTLFKTIDDGTLAVYQGLFNSLILVFATIGSPIGVWIANKKGLRTSLFVMCIIAVLLPILSCLVDNFWYVLAMRGVLGLAIGFCTAVCPMYSSTIVDDDVKGRVGSLMQFSITLFILVGEICTYFLVPTRPDVKCIPIPALKWKLILSMPSVLGVLMYVVLLYGTNPRRAKKVASSISLSAQESLVNGSVVRESLFAKKNIKWLFLAIMLGVMNQFTGVNGVMYYSKQILESAGVPNPMLSQIFVVGLWNMLTVFIFMGIVDKMSRRSIFLMALSIMFVGNVVLIVSFNLTGAAIVAIVGMMLFILGFESGPGPLFFVIASQDFPSSIVDQGTSVANVLMWILNIIIAFFFPVVTKCLGGTVTFIILGVFQILCMLYFGLSMKTSASTKKVTNEIVGLSASHENLQSLDVHNYACLSIIPDELLFTVTPFMCHPLFHHELGIE